MANRIVLYENGLNKTLVGTSNGDVPTWNSALSKWEAIPGASGSGTVTSITAGTGLTGGTITTSGTIALAASGVVASSYGGAATVPAFTVDTYGRLTSVTDTPIAIAASAITSGTLAVARGGTGQSTYTDGQLLIGNTTGNTLSKATLTAGTGITVTNGSGTITLGLTSGIVTASTKGSATASAVVTVDTYGRVTSLTEVAIALDASDISSGEVSIVRGGTARSTLTKHAILLGNDGNPINFAGPGASGQILIAQGVASDPSFQTLSGDATVSSTGTVTVASVGGKTFGTPVAGGVAYGSSTTAYATTSAGTTGQYLKSNGASAPTWDNIPYDFSGEVPGIATDGDEVFHFIAVRDFTIKTSSGSTQSRAYAKTVTGSATFTLTRAGSASDTIGTIVFTGSNPPTVTVSGDKAIAAGDRFTLTATSGAANIDTLYFTFFAVS